MMLMADIGPAWRIERAVPLKPGKMPSLTSGKPILVDGIAGGDAVVAGEDQFQAAADAETVDRRDDRDGQLLQAVEHGVDHADFGDDFRLACEFFKFVDVRADDIAALLARDEDEPFDGSGSAGAFGFLDDGAQFFQWTAAQSICAGVFAVERRPRDTFAVDFVAPVLERSGIESHRGEPSQ